MGAEKVVSVVADAGFPIARLAWPLGSAPKLPWCVFSLYEDAKLDADGGRWVSYPRWSVELYHSQTDNESEAKLEAALAAAFGDYGKTETWVESESCVMAAYVFTDMERNQNG